MLHHCLKSPCWHLGTVHAILKYIYFQAWFPRKGTDAHVCIFFGRSLTKDYMNDRWLSKQDTEANEDILEDIFAAL